MRIHARRRKVERERGGNDLSRHYPTVLSQYAITRTITNTITNTIAICFQLRSQRAEERLARFVQHKLLQFLHHEYSELLILSLSKSGHYLILQALSLLKSGNHSCERPESPDRQSLPENPKNKPIASVGAIEEWELS